MTRVEEMKVLMRKHRENPEPGDYWHEVYCPYFVVLAVSPTDVLVCQKKIDVDPNHWTFDIRYTTTMSMSRFRRKLSYSTPSLVDSSPADVLPGHMMWAVEDWKNSTTIEHTYED
jgi:hypothetical protein